MSIRFSSYVMSAIVALIVFGLLADHIHGWTSFTLALVATTAVALGVMYVAEWIIRFVRRSRNQ